MRTEAYNNYSAPAQLPGPRARFEGFVLERVSAARVSFRGVSHAHRSITTDSSLTSNANVMPVSTLTQHQHGEPDSPESVCGGTLVGGEDDEERAREPASAMRVDLFHYSLQWGIARRPRRQPLQLPHCLLTACRRRRCGCAFLGKPSDRSAQVLSAASAAHENYFVAPAVARSPRVWWTVSADAKSASEDCPSIYRSLLTSQPSTPCGPLRYSRANTPPLARTHRHAAASPRPHV